MTSPHAAGLAAEFGKGHGTAWLQSMGKEVHPEAARVAELLDWLFDGIYHVQDDAMRTDWTDGYHVEFRVGRECPTYDNDLLTRLVVGCHDRQIRCSIEPCSPSRLRLRFHPRAARVGSLWERHPTIETALERMHRMEVLP